MDDTKIKKNERQEDEQLEDISEVEVQEDLQEDKVSDLEQKVEELDNLYKRSVADYRNLEKRFEEERREIIKYANRDLLGEILPAFDNLFLAEKYVEDQGLKLSLKMLHVALEGVGVKRIETEGKDFDPNLMECVTVEEGAENKVLEETRPGFLLNGKVLRIALVKVGGKKD